MFTVNMDCDKDLYYSDKTIFNELTLVENVEFANKLHKTSACDYTDFCELAVINEAGVDVLLLRTNPDYTFPDLRFKKLFIPTSKYDLSANLKILFENIFENLPRNSLYEGLLRAEISGCGTLFQPIENAPLSAKWSPLGVVNNFGAMLAVLTYYGSLEIYVRTMTKLFKETFVSIGNITQLLINQLEKNWEPLPQNLTAQEKYEELKRRANSIKPVCFEWGGSLHYHHVEKVAYANLAVAHANNSISFWKINNVDSSQTHESKIEFLKIKQMAITQDTITTMHWLQDPNFEYLLVGYASGRISLLNIVSKFGELVIMAEICINPEKDLYRISYLTTFLFSDNEIYFVAMKAPYIYVFGCRINQETFILEPFAAHRFNSGYYSLADVKKIGGKTKNRLLMLSSTGGILESYFFIAKKPDGSTQFSVNRRHLYVNINWKSRRPQGLFVSPNDLLIGVLTSSVNKKEHTCSLNMYWNELRRPEQILEQSWVKRMADVWDCLELLRVKMRKDHNYLADYNFGKKNTPFDYKLIVYFATIRKKMYKDTSFALKKKKELQLYMSIKRCKKLMKNKNELSLFQEQSLQLLECFVKALTTQFPSSKMPSHQSLNLSHLLLSIKLKPSPEMPSCYFCKEKIVDINCSPSHFETRCNITHMQVDVYDFLYCLFCQIKVHSEYRKEQIVPFCFYCDSPLERIILDKPPSVTASNLNKVILIE